MSSKGSVKRSEQSLKRRAEYDRNYRKRKKEKCEEDAAHISLLQLQLQRLEEIMAIYESENERLKTENKQLREEIEQMREDLKGVEREVCEASEVITKLHHHSSHLYLENKWIKTNLNKADIVVNNFNELLSDLPRCHSSIALPLINRLTQHLPPKDACEMFGISRWRYYRAKGAQLEVLLARHRGYSVEKVSAARHELMLSIVDELLPVMSGRWWRCLSVTQELVYERYVKMVKERGSDDSSMEVSPTYFYKYLKTLYIHHTDLRWFCPYCDERNTLMKKKENNELTPEEVRKLMRLDEHERIHRERLQAFQQNLCELTEHTLLLAMDFTKHDHITHSFQNLVLCLHKKNAGGIIEKDYRHYIGELKEKNDVRFVIRVLMNLFFTGEFTNFDKLVIWSDGGRKHFKQSGLEYWLMKLQTAIQDKQPQFTIVHNYFQSYHGHGICDVIAAHGKQEASQEMNNTQTNIYTARELAAIIARRAGHSTYLVTQIYRGGVITIPTFDGIASRYHFFYEKDVVKAKKSENDPNSDRHITSWRVACNDKLSFPTELLDFTNALPPLEQITAKAEEKTSRTTRAIKRMAPARKERKKKKTKNEKSKEFRSKANNKTL
jgi:hypothetical protein